MTRRARAIAIARRRQPPSLLPWLIFALLLATAVAAHAQGQATDGRTAPPDIVQPGADSTGQPGTAGASPAHGANGIVTPPASVDPAMPIAKPSLDGFPTPTARPPGAPGGDPTIVPK